MVLAPTTVLDMVTVCVHTASVRWVGLASTAPSRVVRVTVRITDAVLTEFATARPVTWVSRVSRRCVQMDAVGTVVVMVSRASANVMSAMVGSIVPSLCVLTAKMVIVVMMPRVCAKLDGKAPHVWINLARENVVPTAGIVTAIRANASVLRG